MEKISCPKCDLTAMNKLAVSGIEVDQCPKCEGVWFDIRGDELAKILKTGHDNLPDELKRSWNADVGRLAPAEDRHFRCPRCHRELGTYWYAGEVYKTFQVDGCPEGCGIFLDDGELGKAYRFLATAVKPTEGRAVTGGILTRVAALRKATGH